jgi:hypothetical protein
MVAKLAAITTVVSAGRPRPNRDGGPLVTVYVETRETAANTALERHMITVQDNARPALRRDTPPALPPGQGVTAESLGIRAIGR